MHQSIMKIADDFLVVLILGYMEARIGSSSRQGSRRQGACRLGTYPEGDQCHYCYSMCGPAGCTGPGSFLGYGGCTSCWRAREVNETSVICTSPYATCGDGRYLHSIPRFPRSPMSGHSICKRCHRFCGNCEGPGSSYCSTCRFYRLGTRCVPSCPDGTVIDEQNKRCFWIEVDMSRIVRYYQHLNSMDEP